VHNVHYIADFIVEQGATGRARISLLNRSAGETANYFRMIGRRIKPRAHGDGLPHPKFQNFGKLARMWPANAPVIPWIEPPRLLCPLG
jgi:hypothetical protein